MFRTFSVTWGLAAAWLGHAGDADASDERRGEPVAVLAAGADPGAKQPQVAVDADGRIFVAFGSENRIRCATSLDGGATFRVSEVGAPASLALGMRRGPRIAAANGALVATAIGGAHGAGRDGDLLAWRSTDNGATWEGPVRVNTVDGSAREGLHATAGGPDGRVYAAWLDLRGGATELYGAASSDGGASWGPEVLVYRSPDRFICECCHPSLAFAPDGTLYAMWRNHLAGARDLYLSKSTNGGKTFQPAEKLGRRTWILNACPMDGGAVGAGPDGTVETVWMRAGEMFAARPGEPERALGPGVQGWTAAGPAGAYSVWLGKRPGQLLAVVPGTSRPVTLDERASDPVVAAAPGGRGPVVAAWEGEAGSGAIWSVVLERAADAPSP